MNPSIKLRAGLPPDFIKTIHSTFGDDGREMLARLPELIADDDVRLMHGDFHHFNILLSKRGWLAIDPKGVIGPVGYEIGPLMLNPWNNSMGRSRLKVQTARRVDIICERQGWEREWIIQWALAHSILSAWWHITDGMDWEHPLNCAKIFSELK